MAAAEQAAEGSDLSSGAVRILVDQGTDMIQGAGEVFGVDGRAGIGGLLFFYEVFEALYSFGVFASVAYLLDTDV